MQLRKIALRADRVAGTQLARVNPFSNRLLDALVGGDTRASFGRHADTSRATAEAGVFLRYIAYSKSARIRISFCRRLQTLLRRHETRNWPRGPRSRPRLAAAVPGS